MSGQQKGLKKFKIFSTWFLNDTYEYKKQLNTYTF